MVTVQLHPTNHRLHALTPTTCRQICGIDWGFNFRSPVISLSICVCRLKDTDMSTAGVCWCDCLLPSVCVVTLTVINAVPPWSLSPKVCRRRHAEGHIHNACRLFDLQGQKATREPVHQPVYWSISCSGTQMLRGQVCLHCRHSGSGLLDNWPTGIGCTVSSWWLPACLGTLARDWVTREAVWRHVLVKRFKFKMHKVIMPVN